MKRHTRLLALLLAAVICASLCSCTAGPVKDDDSRLRVDRPSKTMASNKRAKDFGDETETVKLTVPAAPEIQAGPGDPDYDDPKFNAKSYANTVKRYNNWLDEFKAGTDLNAVLPAIKSFTANTSANIFRSVSADDKTANAAYSPVSLYMALLMLQKCAGGETKSAIMRLCGLPSEHEARMACNTLYRNLSFLDGDKGLTFANSIWLNSDLINDETPLNMITLNALASDYMASVWKAPMGKPAANQAMKNWMLKETHGLIGVLPETTVDTVSVIMNALYFKDAWLDEFQADLTDKQNFTDAAGNKQSVDMMHKTENGRVYRGDGFDIASLGSTHGEVRFILPHDGVLPSDLLGDEAFISLFTDPDLFAKSDCYDINWSVPKFEIGSDLDLTRPLMDSGLAGMGADYSALSETLDIVLSQIRQLTKVKVDEQGFEAAAVTVIMMDNAAVRTPDPIFDMTLDRPFAFVIMSENVPLFVGAVNQIEA